MTAEIAILNKLAVALATDSAVTISAGKQEQKIYDSADKLFDLSAKNPIGVMIYNGMQFMQAPLQTLISEYRTKCRSFDTVTDAAEDFLKYLNDWGSISPDLVLRRALEAIISPAFEVIHERISKKNEELMSGDDFTNVMSRFKAVPAEVINVVTHALSKAPPGSFVGGKPPKITKPRLALLREIVTDFWNGDDEHIDALVQMAKDLVTKNVTSPGHTGLVIAGFGSKDKFPTLVSYTIDGVMFDRLKFEKTNFVDIDRNGDRARVIPFAQKEMVERFLYGLDSRIERQIIVFCKDMVPEIRNQILEKLEMSEDDRNSLLANAESAERTFIDGLQNHRFEEIRSSSRDEIEGMVEFMPKPELAKMAEALVNLTSIKRRVSRGMETVGGPIDVAVISKTEGFIWVKRKHYFSTDLNPRYLSRVSSPARAEEELQHGKE